MTVKNTSLKTHTFISWLPAIIMMVVIFMGSSIPGQVIQDAGLGKESFHVDAHFFLFFVLCVSYFKATKNVRTAFVLTIVYAFLDEFHQYFVPLRSVSVKDIVTDSAAAVVASIILWRLQPILPKILRDWLNN